MTIIINQFFGLGDILFIEPIYRYYHERGFKIIAPVQDHYYWVKDYIPYVDFRKQSEYEMDYEALETDPQNGCEYIPLRFSTPILRDMDPHSGDNKEHFMLDKYRIVGLDLYLWKTLSWERNRDKEDRLFTELGLEGKEYTFVNEFYGGGFQRIHIPEHGVALEPKEGYTLLDWAKVIENAKEVHTVETSVFYMVEFLKMKAKKMVLYPRPPEDYPIGVKNLLTPKWTVHGTA